MFRIQTTASFGFVVLFICLASQNKVGGEVQVSWYWTPDEWTKTKTTDVDRDYAARPKQSIQAITVKWQQPQLDALGNFCTIRGQLSIPGEGQKGMQPVNWYQGVTVYMGKTPNAKPDWSAGMNQRETLGETEIVSPLGEFVLQVDSREIQKNRALAQSFQFGLALAEHTQIGKNRQQVVWSSHKPAISNSVQMLTIPAAAKLSRELELINHARGWPFSNANGSALIRAVNALQRLGKDQAIAKLEEYLKLTDTEDYSNERDIVVWIIRVLFEPIRLSDRISSLGITAYLISEDSAGARNWPLKPMAVIDDVPLMLGQQVDGFGSPLPLSMQIDWARHHGVVRDEPLRPTKNPLAAAEAILHSRRFKQLPEHIRRDAIRSVRSQALGMVEGMLQPISARRRNEVEVDRQWVARVAEAAQRGIHWDAKREQFVGKRK